jgi:hypothetical protein
LLAAKIIRDGNPRCFGAGNARCTLCTLNVLFGWFTASPSSMSRGGLEHRRFRHDGDYLFSIPPQSIEQKVKTS